MQRVRRYLAFPDVFQVPPAGQKPDNELCGWNGGFDVILGNPPWERVKLQEKEWFVAHGREDIANAPNAADRRRLIQALKKEDLTLYRKFVEDVRRAEGGSHLLRFDPIGDHLHGKLLLFEPLVQKFCERRVISSDEDAHRLSRHL